MKLVSWNVNGLRAIIGKDFYQNVEAMNPDILCLQEIKMQKGQCEVAMPGYEQVFYCADKKGYSGTAVFSRVPMKSVSYGIGIDLHDHEGRVITCDFDSFYLVCCYTPNSQDGLKRLEYRMQWEDDFRAYLKKLDEEKPVLLCGDLNVAHCEIDLRNPKTNRMNPGFTDQERGKMTELLEAGFVDSFRYLHPEEIKYSWWSYRMKARERNVGWRIDYFIVSERAKDKIKAAEIYNEYFGSDHCPVCIEYDA